MFLASASKCLSKPKIKIESKADWLIKYKINDVSSPYI